MQTHPHHILRLINNTFSLRHAPTHIHSPPTVDVAVCLSAGTGLTLSLCWSLDMLAAPQRRATGVLTATQADRSIRGINNLLQTLSQLVHSMIDSPHATNT